MCQTTSNHKGKDNNYYDKTMSPKLPRQSLKGILGSKHHSRFKFYSTLYCTNSLLSSKAKLEAKDATFTAIEYVHDNRIFGFK